MKAFTDIEQSKKLAKILPFDSADMAWYSSYAKDGYSIRMLNDTYPLDIIGDAHDEIPAWSLAALLDVLPLSIYDESDYNDYELEINMIDKMPRYIRLGDISHSEFPWDFEKDTLLDNIVESIIWLNDNNYFEL